VASVAVERRTLFDQRTQSPLHVLIHAAND
jgi:hypothetical protein